MSDEMMIILAVLGGGLILGLLIVFAVKSQKKNMKKIIQTTSPIWVKIIDVLIYKVSSGEDDITLYLPVYQNKRDNKVYVTSRWGNHGYVYPRIEGLFSSTPKVVIKNLKKEDLEFNKEGRLYIEKEKETIKIEDNKILLDGRKLQYSGKFKDRVNFGEIYSVNNDNILELINGATLYYGIADFDMEGVLIEYLNE